MYYRTNEHETTYTYDLTSDKGVWVSLPGAYAAKASEIKSEHLLEASDESGGTKEPLINAIIGFAKSNGTIVNIPDVFGPLR